MASSKMVLYKHSNLKILLIGFLIGFLLNVTGWLGNNFLLGDLWKEVGSSIVHTEWRSSIWRDIFSFLPDYLYGIAIVWLIDQFNRNRNDTLRNSMKSGLFVSLVGGVTTYFAIANSGFIPWKLALLSFILVLLTKLPLAYLAGKLLERK